MPDTRVVIIFIFLDDGYDIGVSTLATVRFFFHEFFSLVFVDIRKPTLGSLLFSKKPVCYLLRG